MAHASERSHKVGDTVFTVKLVHVDAGGNAWYGFDDPLRMPAARALAGEVAATWADLNITKDDLKDYVARMKAFGNQGDIVRMFHLLTVLEERVEWACEDRTLLQLAQVYYLLNDEPIMQPSPEHNEQKERIWAADQECRGFFLRSAFVLTKGYSEFSAADILNYFQVQRAAEQRGGQTSARSTGSAGSKNASKPAPTKSTTRPGLLPRKRHPR